MAKNGLPCWNGINSIGISWIGHSLDRPKMASDAMSLVPFGSLGISQPATSVRVALFELYKPGTPEYAELFEDSMRSMEEGSLADVSLIRLCWLHQGPQPKAAT